MEKRLAVFLTCFMLSCVLYGAEPNPIFQDLMTLHPTWITRSVTSHDPTGGNGDGSYNGTPGEGHYKVLFHGKGEGRITRIWMTADLNHEIYDDWTDMLIIVDGKTIFHGTPVDLFSGHGPWPVPLVMDFRLSSGGFLSYAPIPYKKEAKILLKGVEHYFHVTYREGAGSSQGPSAQDIQTFLKDPWWLTAATPNITYSLQPQNPQTIAQGPGIITSISAQIQKADLKNLMIQIGHEKEVPLAFFFGLATTVRNFADDDDGGWTDVKSSLNYVNPETQLLVSRLPIPLQAGETIKIRTLSTTTSLNVGVDMSSQLPQGVKLKTTFKEQDSPGSSTTMSYFESNLPVQYIGVVKSIEGGRDDRVYLEGDEMIRVSGMQYPLFLGTGTEDFFNGGWYFSGPHTNPMSGEPLYIDGDSPAHALYRYMIFDPIISLKDMRFGFESGEMGNYVPAHYRTLSFAYEFTGLDAPSQFELESTSFAFARGLLKKESLTYDAEKAEVPTDVNDLWSRGLITAQIPCMANTSNLQIIRTFNDAIPGQEADVFINKEKRAHYYEAVANTARSLSQDVVNLPISAKDCVNQRMNLSLKSRKDFSSIRYTLNYY